MLFRSEPTGEFDLKGLLRDGQIRAYEKIGELQSCLKRLQLAERGIQDTEKYRDCDGFYRREIPERNILRREIKEGLSSVEFHKKLSELFELAQKHQLSANYPSGMMLDVEDGDGADRSACDAAKRQRIRSDRGTVI